MKRLGIICMALVCASPVFAQTVFQCNFSAAEGYSDGPLVGQPAGADDQWVDGVVNIPSEPYIVVENEQLMCNQLDGSDTWIWIPFPVQQEGDLTMTWDWQYIGPEDGNVDVGMNISDSVNYNLDGNPDLTWNEQGAMTRMQESNPIIDVRNGDWEGGGSYAADQEITYTDGSLFHMRMVVHIRDLTLDVYVQKEGESDEVMIAEGYGFRRIPSVETDGVNCLAIWLDGNTDGTSAMIDNILIYGDDGPTNVNNWSIY